MTKGEILVKIIHLESDLLKASKEKEYQKIHKKMSKLWRKYNRDKTS
jgi:hypothetical protein